MKILILEDNSIQLKQLSKGLSAHYSTWQFDTAEDLATAQKLLEHSLQSEDYYALFLLDIQLQDSAMDTGGFTFAKTVRTHKPYFMTPILFLTSVHDKTGFALSNFHCYNYIVKPYTVEDIIAELEHMQISGFFQQEAFSVVDTNRITHRIMPDTIRYIEAKSHQVILYTTHGTIVSRKETFASLKPHLTERFIQCHQKYIVNTDYLENYDRKSLFVRVGQDTLPVSRGFRITFENGLHNLKILNGD